MIVFKHVGVLDASTNNSRIFQAEVLKIPKITNAVILLIAGPSFPSESANPMHLLRLKSV